MATRMATKKPSLSKAQKAEIGIAAGISTLGSIATGFAETSAFKSKLDAMLSAKIANMKLATTNYELEQVFMAQEIDELDEIMGDKLSERHLQAIKDEARLKAAAAETGTIGGTTDAAIRQAFVDEHFDRGNIISSIKQERKKMLKTMDVSTQRLMSDLAGISSGLPTASGSSVLSGLAGGLNTLTSTIGMLSKDTKSKALEVMTQG